MNRTLIADRGDAGRRLDLVLRRHLHDVDAATRTRVQAWIENGQVTINGIPVRRAAARAAFGDLIVAALPAPAPRAVMGAENVPVDILYEDEFLLAVDKPAGMVAHPTYKHSAGTLMNALLWLARRWPSHHRPSLVGRLDKDTSGIVLVAKSAALHAALQRTLAHGTTRTHDSAIAEKAYLAVVHGRVNKARGAISLHLARDAADRRRMVASETVGVPSLTCFERLAQTGSAGASVSLLRCRISTGRTHQIRVHLAARGWPIVGDRVYGDSRIAVGDSALAAALRAFPRQALHASRLAFVHPSTGCRVIIEAPLPNDIERLLKDAGIGTGWR
jgi:23S rRNA pseudouridine1911/1915/1917 synthase